ncbi:MAG TPA: hypothetical protein VHU13_07730 [Solirubrobacteraceae bacterium]|jgi:hypothetical protein|nr:hypothetical protein [Solirubrobacteraceae bacterium]
MSTQTESPPTRHGSPIARLIRGAGFSDERAFVLRVVQPALVGMIDGTVSSIAPVFAAAVSSDSHTAFVVGLSTAIGAGISMGISEGLSDTGEQTGRGSPVVRGTITGAMTALGGLFHTLPFLISDTHKALIVAGGVVAVELFAIAWVRQRFLKVSLRSSLVVVTLAGALVLAVGVLIGSS